MLKTFASRLFHSLLVRCLLLVAVLALPARPSAQAVDPTVVLCRLEASVFPDGTTTLYIEVQNAVNLYGYQFDITYNPAEIEVLDGNGGVSGINFVLGSFLSNDFVAANSTNNGTGSGQVAVTQVNPSTPKNGNGEFVHATVRGLTAGSANITLTNVILSDNVGSALPRQVQNCALTVNPFFSSYLPLALNQ